jgi:putative sugar O-methyltransferase
VTVGEPSAFWRDLGADHANSLADHGFGDVKRRQALRYFTWQWRWRNLRRSEQLRFLLRHSRPASVALSLWRPGPLDALRWAGPSWSALDRRMYVAGTRLLWIYAAQTRHPALDLPEPELGSPFPVYLQGRLISQDLANTALELDALRRATLERGARAPRTVLEVGAGYGRTAFALLSLNPSATYTIVDIEPAISISRWYLTELFGPDRVTFVPADHLERLDGSTFDLGISISSLQEMTPAQVDLYLKLFDRSVDGYVLLKQWDRWHNPVDETDMVFDEYPIPTRWQRLLWERCPVQTRFMQGVWRTPRSTTMLGGDPP